jgi:uncharacterized protein YyaL (SSP411 family)
MGNRLQQETSPYLLQHAQNPVDWYPWSSEALERAKSEDKPIFLSIGYAACHWCHVMEHESFENEEIARLLNEHFVCVKVDREERPDLDQIYMTAVQILTGRGGWPMSVFLTPEGQPFFAGTYWPAHARQGMPGFDQVLAAVIDAWQHRRTMATRQAESLTERIAAVGLHDHGETAIHDGLLDGAIHYYRRAFDRVSGGFGGAPKFPHALDLQLLLRLWQRTTSDELLQIVNLSLDKMAAGGIYDHLGGGFARYSVDERWLVPHFEKMLYDNALLAATYVDSYLATGNLQHRQVACETLDYVLRDMRDPAGGFHSSEDADSEGVEGKFYLWTPEQIRQVLDADSAELFCTVYDVTDSGNFEDSNILHLPQSIAQVARSHGWDAADVEARLKVGRERLLARRRERVRPGKDDKVIVSWNGLMIDSLARAARALAEPRYLAAAVAAATFLRDQLWRDGRLAHSWRAGRTGPAAFLDDYGALANAMVSLYEASFDTTWLDWAFQLIDVVLARFIDPAGGALFFTADDHERLITRTKDLQDSSVPSGNALVASALVRLAELGARSEYREVAESIVRAAGGLLNDAPAAAGQMLIVVDMLLGPLHTVAVIADDGDPSAQRLLRNLNARFLPRAVVALQSPMPDRGQSPQLQALFKQRSAIGGQPTCYVCQGTSCWEPAVGEAQAVALWDRLSQQMTSRPN